MKKEKKKKKKIKKIFSPFSPSPNMADIEKDKWKKEAKFGVRYLQLMTGRSFL